MVDKVPFDVYHFFGYLASGLAILFGGERPWFVCLGAGCGRRAAVLYGEGKHFLCRRCYDLVYESQRENGMTRALRRG